MGGLDYIPNVRILDSWGCQVLCQQKQHEQPEEHAPFAPGLGVMGIWVGMAHGGLVYTLDEMEWQ